MVADSVRIPAWDGYFADPFVLRTDDGFVAFGTSEGEAGGAASVAALVSENLRSWRPVGPVLAADESLGTDYWAPEVVRIGEEYWLYYSVGRGIAGHHIRAARSSAAAGPFVDAGVSLTPGESFAIDAHPFFDIDGTGYLFFARDVIDADRPGTHLAVVRMDGPTSAAGDVIPVLEPNADWQVYERDREMYGRRMDWYTLEGPTVVLHDGTYYLFFSGGSWEGDGYGVSYATASSPLGPWVHASADRPLVLSTELTGLAGPGHNSILRLADGGYATAYHAWNDERTKRQLYIDRLEWVEGRPRVVPGDPAPA